MFARVDSIQGVWTYAFNYSQTDHAWVDNQANGPALANYIHCVAQASAEAGGPGKVAIVAFSMGGLLTRYAATTGGRAVDIGMVITIGTPNTGSFEANVGAVAQAVVCATNPQSSFCTQWTALNGMSVFGPEIRDLGKLPPSIPLHAIAGDETYVYKIWNALGAIPLFGDGIVPTGSALDKPPGWMNDTFDTVRNPLVPGDVSAWHLALKSNPQVQQKVHDYIYAYVQAHQPRAPAPVATPSPALGGDAYWLAGGGLWHVHGATLQISQGPSGLIGAETWNDGAQIIIGHAQLTFVSQPDGSLVGTYTGPTTHTYNGPANGMQLPSGEPQQGQDITLVPVAPGLAKTLYDSNSPAMFIGGNPYLCGPGLAVANPSQYCGA